MMRYFSLFVDANLVNNWINFIINSIIVGPGESSVVRVKIRLIM